MAVFALGSGDCECLEGFGGVQAGGDDGVDFIDIVELERGFRLGGRGGGELDGLERKRDGFLCMGTQAGDALEGLGKGGGRVGLVENEQGIVGEQGGVDGAGEVADAIATEEQARAELVEGGG